MTPAVGKLLRGRLLSYQSPTFFFFFPFSDPHRRRRYQRQFLHQTQFIPHTMVKRKRQAAAAGADASEPQTIKKAKALEPQQQPASTLKAAPGSAESIQIVTGSYDRVLHGVVATITPDDKVEFADSFLFNAHSSAIRCLAISPASAAVPGQSQKVVLASGSTDERINLYSLSAHPPSRRDQDALATVAARPILENPKNRELGNLLHHESTVTALAFPSRSKLLSSSEDSTIAVTRTRDWSVLSTIKAPIPKAFGRPSGDTAAFGGTPSGVNDFAIHPSMKLMITVSKGERCMRLWNLVTGKKAGVLNFGRDMLREAGEGKHSSGEGRRVTWGAVDGADEFAVSFDRDVVAFGMDSVPKCRVMGAIKTKVHQMSYIPLDDEQKSSALAVATEDGRVLFFTTQEEYLTKSAGNDEKDEKNKDNSGEAEPTLPVAKLLGYVGGREMGVSGRIKDFITIKSGVDADLLYLVAGSSDGKLRVFKLSVEALRNAVTEKATTAKSGKKDKKDKEKEKKAVGQTLGKLVGTNETQDRITCMAAYMMIPRPEGVEDSEDELDFESESDGDDDDDEDSE
jgi:protein MAK11